MLPSFSLEEQAFVSIAPARVRWRARIRKPDSEKAQEAVEQSKGSASAVRFWLFWCASSRGPDQPRTGQGSEGPRQRPTPLAARNIQPPSRLAPPLLQDAPTGI